LSKRLLAAAAAAACCVAVAPAGASAATYTAYAGADGVSPNPAPGFSANGFFRRTLNIHVGDSVRWQFRGFHTVTFPARGQQSPGLVVPDASKPVSGVLDNNGTPFWFNGQPSLGINPLGAAPQGGTTFDGTKLVGSGLPAGPTAKPFTVTFSKAGRFEYFCIVHPGMRGTVSVRASSVSIPTARQNVAARTKEVAAVARHARVTAAKPAPAATPTGATVQVGRAPLGERFTIDRFFPSTVNVKVGQTVAFSMGGQNTTEAHTVTFGPPNVRKIEPIGPAGFNPLAAYPSDPPNAPFPPYDGRNHGSGFLNTGLLDNDSATPQPNTARISFSAAGTYPFECVLHPGMEGTVVVTS
jgi:plastocyanin